MNLYFLVEGRRTEAKVYPKWLSHLLPHFSRVNRPSAVIDKNYFLISGEGNPSILDVHLPNAIGDFNDVGRYDYLVLCFDAEESTPEECVADVELRMDGADYQLARGELKIIVQNRSIETWFLGNRKVLTRSPQSRTLARFKRFYDVSVDDPEKMGRFGGHSTHAQFHAAYLREMFREKKIAYTKRHPGHVMESAYLEQLQNRVSDEPDHLKTFQSFIAFCEYIGSITGQPSE